MVRPRIGRSHALSGSFMLEAPGLLGLPELQQDDGGSHGNHGTQYVHQIGSDKVAHDELRDTEAEAGRQAGRPYFHHLLAAGHGPDEPEGHDEGEDRQLPSHHGAEGHFRKSRHLGQGDDGDAEGAVGDGRRVADEGQAGCLEGPEAEADEHGSGNGDRRAEARSTFDEGAEAEADEEQLDAAVIGDPGDGMLHYLEVARLHRDVIHEDGSEDDPADGQEPIGSTIGRSSQGELRRHPVHEDRDGKRREEPQHGGPVRLDVGQPQEPQQDDHGDRRHESRKKYVAKDRRVYLSPSEHFHLHEWVQFIGVFTSVNRCFSRIT